MTTEEARPLLAAVPLLGSARMVGLLPANRSSRSRRGFGSRAAALCAFLALLSSCTSVEQSRIRQLLHEKGFGTRAQGVATAENYVAGGDQVQFVLDPNIYLQPGLEQLYLLAQPQAVGIDGTIFVPYIGSVYVLGMKEQELGAMVAQRLGGRMNMALSLQSRIISTGKGFYMFGEVERAARYVPMSQGDITLLDVMAKAPITDLANLGRVKVIKPDAQDPLVVVVNVREIIETGNTTFNLRIDNQDIIYIPPTFLGHIARFVEKLLQPIGAVTRAAFGFATIRSTYDYLIYDQADAFLFRGNRRF